MFGGQSPRKKVKIRKEIPTFYATEITVETIELCGATSPGPKTTGVTAVSMTKLGMTTKGPMYTRDEGHSICK